MDVPAVPSTETRLPRHIAIIMDGNGRWAKQRFLPRVMGHRAGVGSLIKTVDHCLAKGIEALTVFAFSSENWRRPPQEVSFLMELIIATLERETQRMHKNGVKLQVIGDRSVLAPVLQARIAASEELTRQNSRINLLVAINYGGRWDVLQAARRLAAAVERGELRSADIDSPRFESHLALVGLPEPDLFIRTGGEQRISNFLLWQLAYTELYFTPVLWPDFDESALDRALEDYAGRQRRFGHTGEQVENFSPG